MGKNGDMFIIIGGLDCRWSCYPAQGMRGAGIGYSLKENTVNVSSNGQHKHLMESGLIRPVLGSEVPMEVRRGMAIRTSEGREVGRVAAVVIDGPTREVTHIILGRRPQTVEYRLVPIGLVEEVATEAVVLGILNPLVEELPEYHGAS
jgi:sporulation protein YlmC with PRC-barrel domain